MPIHCPIATQRITQDEFKQIAGSEAIPLRSTAFPLPLPEALAYQ